MASGEASEDGENRRSFMRTLLRVLTVFAAGVLVGGNALAAPVSDPVGDFLPTLAPAAPRAGDLDAVSANVSLIGDSLLFSATLNAPINTTPEAFYVWGVDRGAGGATANFSSLGLPDIVFDAVVIIQNEGTGVVNDLTGMQAPAPLIGGITSSGNTIEALVPLSLLPSRGFSPAEYGWNLWPRWGGIPFSDAQISDFAPDANNAQVTVAAVPGPAPLLLLSIGLSLVVVAVRGAQRQQTR
jgi:hypothetical protein